MIMGTMSNAGKSFVAAGLCRLFTEDGYRVAPFKAQNMALNSFITKKGEEMGRSQVVQAEACRKEPDARMNPILLKPTTDMGSQIIILGHPVGNMNAKEYYRHKNEYLPFVREAFESLSAENDIIVLEGAGSPAEINLKDQDIVNMAMAEMADAPVVLVGNIDPGGVFAQLYGTVKLLDPGEQNRIKGLIINKFRGDISILKPGIGMLEERIGKPVLGILPYTDVRLEPEDSLAMEEYDQEMRARAALKRRKAAKNFDGLDIAVIRFPKISNFTDFEALQMETDVQLRYVTSAKDLGAPDLIILPGTKSTISDLLWMRQNGLERSIRTAYQSGTFIAGICGGYQMLGRQILDPEGVEMKGEVDGLGYLDMVTRFSPEKIMQQTVTVSDFGIPPIDGLRITGYEVHMGRPERSGSAGLIAEGGPETGAIPADDVPDQQNAARPSVIGTYIHGIFDEEEFRKVFLEFLYNRKGKTRKDTAAESPLSYRQFREKQISELATMLRDYLDIPAIYKMMGLS